MEDRKTTRYQTKNETKDRAKDLDMRYARSTEFHCISGVWQFQLDLSFLFSNNIPVL